LIKFQQLLYRQGVVYTIIKFIKSESNNKPFKNVDEFWTTCAKLQIKKNYTPAQYWYVLNELFNSIYLIFVISTITSFCTGQWILGIVYFILAIFACNRAKQYADHFIQTVCRLTTASKSA